MLGIVLAISAACCWSIAAMLTRLGLRGNIRVSTGAFISTLSSLVLLGGLALILNFDDIATLTPVIILWFAMVGIVNYVMGRQFNFQSIQRIGAAKATILFSSAPLFSLILAVIFLGETINAALVIGTLSIVSGIYLVVTSQ